MKCLWPKIRVLTANSGKAVPSPLTLEKKSNFREENASSIIRVLTPLAPSCPSATGAAASPGPVPVPQCLPMSSSVFSYDLLKLSEQRKYCELMSHFYLTYSNSLIQTWLAPVPPHTQKKGLTEKNTWARSTILLNECISQHTVQSETLIHSSFNRSQFGHSFIAHASQLAEHSSSI